MHKCKIFLVVIFSLILSSCSEERDENVWVVGTSADNPPYEYMHDGRITGFDIDLMKQIAGHLGKDIKFKNMDFHGLIAALTTKNLDMIISGLSITPERLRRVDFSVPYTDAKIAVLYYTRDRFQKTSDLTGKAIGAQLGTVWSLIAHDLSSQHRFSIKSLANNLLLVEELKNKQLDAMILEESQAARFISIYPQFSSFNLEQYSSAFAVALQKKSPHTKNINHAIKALRSNGTIEALARKWGIIGAE
ncbi:MAG: amino acid ABC transporter substrate-binding protein [Rickettsiales bacterium]|nr:MAG: amino acid ABC transporter substrate-binding protein [Rickettsiales bacterium]